MLFQCSLAKFIWKRVICALDFVRPPQSSHDLARRWVESFPISQRKLVLCGKADMCWTLQKTRNDSCFNHKLPMILPMQSTCLAT